VSEDCGGPGLNRHHSGPARDRISLDGDVCALLPFFRKTMALNTDTEVKELETRLSQLAVGTRQFEFDPFVYTAHPDGTWTILGGQYSCKPRLHSLMGCRLICFDWDNPIGTILIPLTEFNQKVFGMIRATDTGS